MGLSNLNASLTKYKYKDPNVKRCLVKLKMQPPPLSNHLEVKFSVVYGSIYNRWFYEEIKIYGLPNRSYPQRGGRQHCDN